MKTLRDEIAIEAMKALIINNSAFQIIAELAQRDGVSTQETLAGTTYYLADQMMKARDEKE